MGMAYRLVYLLLTIAMCRVEGAYTSTDGGKEVFSSRLNKLHAQKAHFTRIPCQWNQNDRSVMCQGRRLRTVPSDLPQSARKLYLGGNFITALLNTSFEPYSNLVTLDLRLNKLTTIQSAAFQPLTHLKFLILMGNLKLAIPNSAPFHPLNSLVYLIMNSCNLRVLPIDFLDWFPHLKYLDLSGTHLSSLNVSRCKTDRLTIVALNGNKFHHLTRDKFIFACPHESLGLLNNPISYISEDVIASLPGHSLVLGMQIAPPSSMLLNLTSGVARSTINMLILANMELRDGIPDGVFTPLYGYPLYKLAIVNSGDLLLRKNVFLMLTHCIELMLKGNSIGTVEPDFFLGMSSLQKLDLKDSQIRLFNPHNTTWECNMEELDMSQNKLLQIQGYQFCNLSKLRTLNLSRNRELAAMDILSYGGFESLEILDVTGTAISVIALSSGVTYFYFADRIPAAFDNIKPFIPGRTFGNTLNLEFIDVSNSKLSKDSIRDSFFNRTLFQGLVALVELHLSNNPLENLPDMIFEDNFLLAYLMMDNCKISSLNGNIFWGLHSLVLLDLNGNNLLLISSNALKNLPVLETLSINDNAIMFVEEGAVESVPFLRNLSLSNNQLVAFNRSTWNTLMKIELGYIDVSGNPFACQCRNSWLHDLSTSSKMILHPDQTFCLGDSVSQMRGKPLLQFDPNKYCAPNIVLHSTVPFVALAVLVCMLLAFHNRWLIRYKLFLLRLAIIGYREMYDPREHGEFVFDFNIMFTEEDEEWARERLRYTLEDRLPDYNTYSFGDEDLILGMHYLDAVHYAVEHSFKTILLLSRRAVRDNWFLIKFRTAMDHVNDELIENTVVIFLEDIPEDEIPYLVRLYLRDRRPYMTWPEDIRGQDYFWNKLTKIVTFNLRYNPLIPPE